MTMLELSVQYAGNADAIHRRLLELRAQEEAAGDARTAHMLRQRIQELMPLWREARELSNLTAHYYDRSYRVYACYRI